MRTAGNSHSERRHHHLPNQGRLEAVWRGTVQFQGKAITTNLTHTSSELLERLTGYSFEEAAAIPGFITHIAADPTAEASLVKILQVLRREQSAAVSRYRIKAKDGHEEVVEIRAQRLRHLGKDSYEILGSFSRPKEGSDQAPLAPTPLSEPEDTIRHLAFHDTLTNLPNRIQLGDFLADSLESNDSTAVLFIDLDGFKKVNDTLGHQAGDELLIEVAARLQRAIRDQDLVARFGGDEFVVVLRQIEAGDAERIAEEILGSIEQPISTVGREVYVSGSVGISTSPQDGTTAEELLRNADNALYEAKDAGKATIKTYNQAMHLAASAKLIMEESLRKALARNEFFLEYQPVCCLRAGKVVAAEALIRWRHPLRDVVQPEEFMSLAEEVGLIDEIGSWMIHTAISQAQSWIDAGTPFPRIALNVTSRQFRQKDFATDVIETFAESNVSPNYFQLEITEGAAMQDISLSLPKLEQLRQAGFRLSLDGFGKGTSSLAHLRQLPFAGLKVDRAFVREMLAEAKGKSLFSALIQLSHAMGVEICSEGIETDEQCRFLMEVGCDAIQGNVFSRPLSAAKLQEFIKSKSSEGKVCAIGKDKKEDC